MTRAPWVAAQVIPLAMSDKVAEPPNTATRTGISKQPQHTPATPMLLLVSAAATPAIRVPCPAPDPTSVVVELLSTMFQPGTNFPARSGTVPSIPVSTIAIVTLLLPVLTAQASGARIFGRAHWRPYA